MMLFRVILIVALAVLPYSMPTLSSAFATGLLQFDQTTIIKIKLEKAQECIDKGDYTTAKNLIDEVLKVDKNNTKAKQMLAICESASKVPLNVSKTSLSFSASGGSETITISGSSDWSVSVQPASWGHLTRKGNTLTLAVEKNTFPSSRTDYFDVRSGAKIVRVHVSQDKPNILKVSSENLSFSASGGSQTVTVTASDTWSFETNISGWGHLEQKENTIIVSVDANNLSSSRTDYFEIKSGDKTVRVNISQEKADILLVSSEQLSFPASGGSQNVTVTASGTWSIGTKTYDWGHLTTIGNTIVVSVDANGNTNARGDYFTIKSGDLKKTISIAQSAFTAQDLERIEKEQYENACQKGTADALLEYLRAYPNGQYVDSASNKIAIAKAKALDKSSTNEAFNEALAYAKDTLTRYTVKEYIKSCEKEQEKSKNKEKGKQQMIQPVTSETSDREATSNKPISKLSQRPSSDPTGYVNGHEWVDLGLSVKWATCNIGAESPYDFGDYYAWGEKKTKEEYTMENSLTYKINSDSIAGVGVYDVAESIWGGTWRLPTVNEFNELIGNCKFEWSSRDGLKGYNVTGPSGESIFIPAAGWRCESALTDAGEKGLYWSATLIEKNPLYAYGLYFFEGYFCSFWINHRIGGTVRPVTE